MREFYAQNYVIRLMNHSDINEVKEVQRLRYLYLLRDYNPSLPIDGIDDDGYDQYSDSIIVIDKNDDKIVGTYRVASKNTIKDHKYIVEEEYNINALKNSNDSFIELSRAVINPEYRNGFVIELLFLAIYRYMIEENHKYMLGVCSFHGTNPSLYNHAFSLLKRDYSFDDYDIYAINDAFSLDFVKDEEIDEVVAKEQMPGLLRMYLRFGNKVARGGFIDRAFNCCDVFVILDVNNINTRYLNRFERLVK